MVRLVMKRRLFIALLMVFMLVPSTPYSDEVVESFEVEPTPIKGPSDPEAISEVLQYDISYGMFDVGRSSIEVLNNPDGTVSIITRARSEGWVDKVYPVDDYAESIVESFETLKPVKYIIKTREGKGRKHREYRFDHEAHKVRYIDYLKKQDMIYNAPYQIFDPLSAFFYTRRIPLTPGETLIVPMFDSRKVWPLEVSVLRRKTVEVKAGEFDSVAITPKMSSDGIFSSDGDMTIWLTDDTRRVPVLVNSKVLIGSVKVKLTGGRY